jgi:tetratricopeptide (TPR) repeat protein
VKEFPDRRVKSSPRKKKVRVCSQTEKKKSELFNRTDSLVENQLWDQALNNLQYLLRNTPSFTPKIYLKIAEVYFNQKEYSEALSFLYKLIPSFDTKINDLTIKSLLLLEEYYHAVRLLACSPLRRVDKDRLYQKHFKTDSLKMSEYKNIQEITIRCSKCGTYLFFQNRKIFCPECQENLSI